MPRHAQISVSNRCNLRCKMCDIGQRDNLASGLTHNIQKDTELSAEKWAEILSGLEVDDVHIVGVEPLLYKPLEELLSRLSALGISTYVTTNGFLLDEQRAEFLARECARIDVSIDGPTAAVHDLIRGVPGSFDRAVKGLSLLQEYGARSLGVSCAITPDNDTHLVEIYDRFFTQMGVGVTFSHYNYIAPESCESHECQPSNMEYDPASIDLKAVNRAIKVCKSASFLPDLRGMRELKRYYRQPPTHSIKKRCVVVDGILAGQRFTLSTDGTYLIAARCWYADDIGSALNGDVPAESPIVSELAREIDESGLPAACQRLCCAGKTV